MNPKKDKRTFFSRYWWLFAGVLSAVALSTALNITNTDGYLVITNPYNDTWVVDFNTTRVSGFTINQVEVLDNDPQTLQNVTLNGTEGIQHEENLYY